MAVLALLMFPLGFFAGIACTVESYRMAYRDCKHIFKEGGANRGRNTEHNHLHH